MYRRQRGCAAIAVTIATALGIATALAGCADHDQRSVAATSIAPPTPSPARSAPAITYDLDVHRTFLLSDGSTAPGCVQVAVERDEATADAQTDERIAAARKLLLSTNWEAEPVSLDELGAEERQVEKDRGESEAEMLSGVLSDHISKALQDAGLMGGGISLRGHVGC